MVAQCVEEQNDSHGQLATLKIMEPKQQPLTKLQQDNLEAALAESAAIKGEMKKRLARILARMQASGEIRADVTIDDILREDKPEDVL